MAEYNHIIDSSLTTKVLHLKYIDALEKIAKSGNTKVVILGGKELILPKMLDSD